MQKVLFLSLFTLLVALPVAAQYTEDFDAGNRGDLQAACWFFASTSVQTSNGQGNLIDGPGVRTGQLTNVVNPHTLGTPCTSFSGDDTISFTHYVHTLAGNTYKRLDVVLVDPSSGTDRRAVDTLLTYFYNSTALVETEIPTAVVGEYKVEWRWIGVGGQGRAWIDRIRIGGQNISDPGASCTCAGNTFPVEWADVDAQWVGGRPILTWSTLWETNTAHFDIERSADGRSFSPIGQVAAAGTSSDLRSYRFSDDEAAAFTWQRLHYRIRQVDLDGRFSYSSIQTLDLTDRQGSLLAYPNPARDQLTIALAVAGTQPGQLTITDLTGRTRYVQTLTAGQHEISLSVAEWQRGLYLVRWTGSTQLARLLTIH
ncbi:MAG: hypothetical protein OHK0039_11850 [Bacteroidia bacterium]